jgi:hypothetical protein
MQALNKVDFHYCVEYDYDNYTKCHCYPDYCRCSTIDNFRIISIDPMSITEQICNNYKCNEITKYALSRVCMSLTADDFEVDIDWGYYGQEIEGIYLVNDRLIELIQLIIFTEDNDARIRMALTNEYGYLLDELKDCHFELIDINLNDIIFGQPDHYRKLRVDIIEKYRDYEGICGIVKEKDGKYSIVDGYHRCKAALDNVEGSITRKNPKKKKTNKVRTTIKVLAIKN